MAVKSSPCCPCERRSGAWRSWPRSAPACSSRRPDGGRGRRRRVRREPGLSVLLVTVDTLRADALGAYGNRERAHPMDGPPRRRAACASTTPTPTTWSRSRPTPTSSPAATPSSTACGTTPASASRRGWTRSRPCWTPAATGRAPSSAPSRSTRGSVSAEASTSTTTPSSGRGPGRPSSSRSAPGAETVALARRWLEAQRRPALLLLGAPLRAALPVRAARAVRLALPRRSLSRRGGGGRRRARPAARAALGRRRRRPDARGPHRRPRRVARGARRERPTAIFAYEATLRVPLVLYQPRLFSAATSSRRPSRHVDLLPTILDALALPVPDGPARPQPPARSRPERASGPARATSRRSPDSSTAAGRRSTA